ncbi:MAG: M13 family metallopeptidase [Bacteroidaceae bacterium]|nr:M13 family metallopeptidase [Bacteroidaceae bacterium]MBQ8710207.1 M13 family metallopeptidase [Bacteroidaceae bacterium]MCI6803104.1 M13 family metallopeptidase [Prevotellaceae bacterium]MDY6257799.1 M13 family metallopeptidase [Bacteroidaceae bacterium]
MKAKKILLMMTMAASLTACNQQTTGLKLENMDTTVKPGTDFYQYACGGWIKNNPLKPEYSSYGSFDVVVEENQKRIRELIEDLASKPQEQGSLGQKIGDLYALRMDSVRQNKEGVKPVLADMERVAKVKTTEELMTLLNQMNTEGVAFGELWGYYVGADMMVSTQNLLELSQGGYSIERDYYVKDDEANKKILEAYKKHVVKMFQLVGETADAAQQKMENVLKVEMRMAKAGRDNVALRDPASNYHKMSFADFQKDYEGFDWKTYFDMQGMTDIDSLSVGQPEAVKEALAVLKDTPVEVLKDFFLWQILDSSGGILGDKVYEEVFDFEGRILTGAKEPRPRWKRSVSAVNGILGEAVGQMYVEKYFPPANKARMEELIKNLQTALGERIDAQEWMSESTKKAAHEKLDAFYVKVGYPDKWRDYSKMNIDPQKSLYENMKEVAKWAHADMLARKWKKPVDRDEWHMTPQTVNAYYNPTTNEICFPAGILQYPFFDMEADDAFNYGAIGVVIGHEMSHGFDDQGRQFDKDGNFRDWWADGDGDKYNKRAQVIKDFFSAIKVLPDLNANGDLCCGENLGDHGGLKFAYAAFKNATKDHPLPVKDGFTPEQRFFLAYAGVWAENITEEAIRNQTTADPHSLGKWRVNGALPLIDAWYDAFGITESDPMFVPKEKRVKIW